MSLPPVTVVAERAERELRPTFRNNNKTPLRHETPALARMV